MGHLFITVSRIECVRECATEESWARFVKESGQGRQG